MKLVMKFRVIILLFLFSVPAVAYAASDPGCKDKAKATHKKQPTVHSIEQFVFMIPSASGSSCDDSKEAFREAVVNYYRWYLQNENRISDNLSRENKGKDLMPPFNISWETLHEYFEVITKKYAGWLPSEATAPAEEPGTAYINTDGPPPPTDDSLVNGSTVNLSNLAK